MNFTVLKTQFSVSFNFFHTRICDVTESIFNLQNFSDNFFFVIFQYYHERPCSQCHFIPSETSICLLCGTIVCFKQICCKQQNVCEAVAHSIECGGGTGIFLVVTSTYIVVIRSHRACMWGSLYLDDFEEEDKDLKWVLVVCYKKFDTE